MDLGQSRGGLPPDEVVEDIDAILTASQRAIADHHDPSFDSMLRIGLAPCSPFSVTADLLRASAELARESGVRLHTHLCETIDEENYCREHFDATPVEYMESLGWLGPDVWYAHAVHLDDASIAAMARTGTSAAHCPASNARLGLGDRPGAGHAGSRRGRRAGCRRGRLQRGLRPPRGVAARRPLRARPRWTAGDRRTRRPGHGHHGRSAGAGSRRRDRFTRGRQARRPGRLADGHVGPRRHRRPGGGSGARYPTAAGAPAGQRGTGGRP